MDQENNDLLLNAIRNKFASQSTNEAASASYSPPNFTIPILRMENKSDRLQGGAEKPYPFSNESKLNNFLLNRCQTDKNLMQNNQMNFQRNQEIDPNFANRSTKFVIPQLKKIEAQLSDKVRDMVIDEEDPKITSLRQSVYNLKFNDAHIEPAPAIDLTTALSFKNGNDEIATKGNRPIAISKPVEHFKIPFIECDRKDRINDYKLPENSNIHLILKESQPSAVGSVICFISKNTPCMPPRQKKKQKTNYKIEPFKFDTQSPDDYVLASLNKYQRLHHN